MMFWIVLGLILVVPSIVMMTVRYFRGASHKDSEFTRLLDWPLLVTGILMMIPTWVWWDFTVGLIAMIAWELYKFIETKRKHAEHDFAQATNKKETA